MFGRQFSLIKPFLAGRDVKRYIAPKTDKFLIFTRRGIDIEQYPAILKYLEQFKERLTPQPKEYTGKEWPGCKAGTYKWYEIQDAVDYYGEFERGKIVFPDIALKMEATLSFDHEYCGNTLYIIPDANLKLLGLLCSKVVSFFYANITSSIRGGYLRFIRQYLEQIPVPPGLDQVDELEILVDKLIRTRRGELDVDVAEIEEAIDRVVYGLCGLVEGEIGVVEGVIDNLHNEIVAKQIYI